MAAWLIQAQGTQTGFMRLAGYVTVLFALAGVAVYRLGMKSGLPRQG
jgi:hypothetical protein